MGIFDKLTGKDKAEEAKKAVEEKAAAAETKVKTAAELAKEQAEAKLKMMLADAEVGLIDGYKISWKNVTTTRLDSKKVKSLLTEEQLKDCSTTTVARKFNISAPKK